MPLPKYDAASLLNRAIGRLGQLPRRLGVEPSTLEGSRILEVGCGNGECTAAAIQEYRAEAYGIDTNPRWQDFNAPYHHLGTEGRLIEMDASDDIVRELGKFDFVHSYTVFEHIEQPRETLKNIYFLLEPKGRAFLSFNLYLGASASHLAGYLPDMPWIHLTHTEEQAKKIMLERHGISRGFSWVNKLTHRDYIAECQAIGFNILKTWYVTKIPEPDFLKQYEEKLSAYSVEDLSKNFMNITLERPE